MTSIPHKTCTRCNQLKPRTIDNFIPDVRYSDGFNNWCKDCYRAYRAENREKLKRQYHERYMANQEQNIKNARQYRRDNKEVVNARDRERYHRDMEDDEKREVERLRVRLRNRRLSKDDEWRERDRLVRRKRYRRNPHYREKGRINAMNRRARKMKAEGTFTQSDVNEMRLEQDDHCAYCGITLHGKGTIDHIIPLSRGGSNWPSNLCLACKRCNFSKKDKTPDEWLAVRGW